MKAIILAGGLGTRLRPLTTTCPKPLLPVGNLPILTRIILSLRQQEIRDFLFLLHYRPESFKTAFGTGKAFDAHFEYIEIEKDLGTAGSMKYIGDQIRETSLVYSADVLAEVPVQRMLDFHHLKKALATIALYPMVAPLAFGIVLRRGDGSIARFLEKPSWPQVFSDWINSGIYIVEPGLIEHIPNHGAFAMLEKEVFPPLAARQAPIFSFPLYGYWRDVGTPEDLRLANIDFIHGVLPSMMLTLEEQEQLRLAVHANQPHNLWRGENSRIASETEIHDTVIGKNCRVAPAVKISRSVILDDVQIGEAAEIKGAIVMHRACIGAGARLSEDALIGTDAVLGAGALLHHSAIVKPGDHVQDQGTITAQKILPTGYIRRFVDGGSLLGAPDESFNHGFLNWVGKAYASQQRSNTGLQRPILLATADGKMLGESFHALAEGVRVSGIDAHLLREVTLPIVRKILHAGAYAGALYLAWDDFSGLLRVALLHPNGKNYSTLEACALERVELLEEKTRGECQHLEAVQVHTDYLEAMAELMPRLKTPKRLLLGVVGSATEIIVKQFLEKFGVAAHLVSLPLQMQKSFGKEVAAFQKSLVQKYEEGYDLVFWLCSTGERIRLLLPGLETTHFGISDTVLAQLLSQKWIRSWPAVYGWLMPDMELQNARAMGTEAIPLLTGMNSAMAKRAHECGFSKWYGFDGNGGITVSEWMNYQDALMAWAHVLSPAAEKGWHKLAQGAKDLSTDYRVVGCPDDAKAQVMRRLIESFGDHNCEVSDGVKIRGAAGWVAVRLCAGRPALEVFKCSWTSRAKDRDDEIKALFGRVLRNLNDWIGQIK